MKEALRAYERLASRGSVGRWWYEVRTESLVAEVALTKLDQFIKTSLCHAL